MCDFCPTKRSHFKGAPYIFSASMIALLLLGGCGQNSGSDSSQQTSAATPAAVQASEPAATASNSNQTTATATPAATPTPSPTPFVSMQLRPENYKPVNQLTMLLWNNSIEKNQYSTSDTLADGTVTIKAVPATRFALPLPNSNDLKLNFDYYMAEDSFAKTDGAEFRVLVQLPGDKQEEVFKASLNPKDNPADRDIKHAVVTINQPGATKVIFETQPGASGSNFYDHCMLANVTLENNGKLLTPEDLTAPAPQKIEQDSKPAEAADKKVSENESGTSGESRKKANDETDSKSTKGKSSKNGKKARARKS